MRGWRKFGIRDSRVHTSSPPPPPPTKAFYVSDFPTSRTLQHYFCTGAEGRFCSPCTWKRHTFSEFTCTVYLSDRKATLIPWMCCSKCVEMRVRTPCSCCVLCQSGRCSLSCLPKPHIGIQTNIVSDVALTKTLSAFLRLLFRYVNDCYC